jgi:hypothetical protein
MLAVFARDGDQRRLLWNRALAPQTELDDPSMNPFSDGRGFGKLLSNDGSVVILRPEHANDDDTALRVLTRKGTDLEISAADLMVPVAEWIENEHFGFGDKPIELLLDAEKPPIYATWVAEAEKWLTLNLTTFKLSAAQNDVEKRLDALGLATAREIVKESQGGVGLARILGSIRQKAAEVLPGMIEPQAPRSEET